MARLRKFFHAPPFLLFLLVFVSYGYFFQSGKGNANARYDHVRALAEEGRHTIDSFWMNTQDVVKFQGHIYSNKPPGLIFPSVPAWWWWKTSLEKVGVSKTVAEHLVCFFVNWTVVGLFSALLAVVMYAVLKAMLQNSQRALLLTLAYSLGTLAFPFSTCFFSHQFTAFLLFASFALLFFVNKDNADPGQSNKFLLSALCASYAISCEYTAALGAGPLMLYALFKARQRRHFFFIAAGFLLGLLPLLLFNLSEFHQIFFFTYGVAEKANNPFYDILQEGFMGFTYPKLHAFVRLTFHPYRGLFYCNPWLLLFLPGLFVPFFQKRFRAELFVSMTVFCLFLLFVSGLSYWHGGTAFGPRYLVPALPFVVIVIAPLLQRRAFRYLFYPLALLSVAFMLMVTAVGPYAQYGYQNPLLDFSFHHFIRSRLSSFSVGVFNSTLLTEDSVAFNIGELLRLAPEIQLLPLLLIWLLLFAVLLKSIGILEKKETSRVPLALAAVFLLAFQAIPLGYSASRQGLRYQERGFMGIYAGEDVWPDLKQNSAELLIPESKEAFAQISDAVDYRWYGGNYAPPMPTPFSVEWRGTLLIPEGGSYRFFLEADESVALYLDNRPVLVQWQDLKGAEVAVEVSLAKGETKLVLRYRNLRLGGRVKLSWQRPGQKREVLTSKFMRIDSHSPEGMRLQKAKRFL